MKPRTKLDKRLDGIVQTLSTTLTDSQWEYCKDNAFVNVVTESRGRFYCSYCGHTWRQPINAHEVSKCECPNCKRESQVKHRAASDHCTDYFVISDSVGDWQMFKYFQVIRHMTRGNISYKAGLIAVVFLDENGKVKKFMRNRNFSWYYNDIWSWHSPISLKNDHYGILEKLGVGAILTYDRLPVLERNGWDGSACGFSAHSFCYALLTNPQIESWWKQGQKGVVAYHMRNDYNERAKYEPLIKLATRHKRFFHTYEDWIDFTDFVKDLEYLGKDIHNPSLIFPENFQEAHELWHRRAEKKRAEIEAERQRQMALKQAERDREKKEWLKKYALLFSSMSIEKNGYQISPLITSDQFKREGDAMHHCVATYYGKVNTLLLSIRKDGKRQETAEIDLKNKIIVQCRGLQNKPSDNHDEIVRLLQECMFLFNQYYKGKKQQKQQEAISPQPMTQALVKIA